MSEPHLSLVGVHKSFGGVSALKPVDLQLYGGEILGLIGENGAGKSTLIKLLGGVYVPDGGSIMRDGKRVCFSRPRQSLDAGIAVIHQELEYFSHLTVAENMLMGEPWPRTRWGGVDWKQMHQRATAQLERFGVPVLTRRHFRELSAVEKQEVAIASALSRDARLLVLDEPTASLTEPEVERLFGYLRRLRAEGVAILYVSHRLDEICSLTDCVAVLRDGSLVGTFSTSEVDPGRLVHEMIGRPLDQVYPHKRGPVKGEPLLAVNGLTRAGMFYDVSLQVRAGEVVGLAGLVGAGRSELARAIYGLYPADAGTIHISGQPVVAANPRRSIRARLAYLPEERKRQGFVLEHSVRDSLTISLLDLLSRGGIISRTKERDLVRAALAKYDIRAHTPSQPVGTLSGGNQQKVLLARWLERHPDVILLDEPTRGVDVGAKAEIHALIDALAQQQKAVLLISSDLPELVGMSDRVLVMNRGRITAELQGAAMNEHQVILAASGLDGSSKAG